MNVTVFSTTQTDHPGYCLHSHWVPQKQERYYHHFFLMLYEVDATTDVVRSILAMFYWFSFHSHTIILRWEPIGDSRSGLCCVEGGRQWCFNFVPLLIHGRVPILRGHSYVYIRFIITIILITDSILDTYVCIMIIAEYLIQRDNERESLSKR